MNGLKQADHEAIIKWAAKHQIISEVYLYGSRARGDHRSDSDVDLAVAMPFEDWFWWHAEYKANPDLDLSAPIHLEWWAPDAGLERVGEGVEADGILLYRRSYNHA